MILLRNKENGAQGSKMFNLNKWVKSWFVGSDIAKTASHHNVGLENARKDQGTYADEDPVIDEILKQEPENQVVVYEPQRAAAATTTTATEQLIGIDNSSKPAFLRPINAPLPAIYFKDIIGQKPTEAETKDIINSKRRLKPRVT